jgi:hypothetical protein
MLGVSEMILSMMKCICREEKNDGDAVGMTKTSTNKTEKAI